MQSITVAISDTDAERQRSVEHALRSELGITVLMNTASSIGEIANNRRLISRDGISAAENAVARVRRLNPSVLLANLNQCMDADCAMLVSLRQECPDTKVILFAEKEIEDQQVMQALASGARGCLSEEITPAVISRVVKAVDQGEAWVPRKMLGKIMDEVMHWSQESSGELP